MSYIVVTRNPSNKRLLAIKDDDGEVSEFDSGNEAIEAADNTTACIAWGYEILEVTKP